ncbi:response regulator [Flagellimonas sp. 389]|uniref:hybrid sensor histidine kinase/response regulator transcription factor n=1 Tax=Flagellimonas sp. 389 TaxID=2835862 RepID=UPI001BD4143B|nr:hybrid sensor histidine kinase/response regulator transcription factor [Flagellimonas sp. 389]MBS9461061.1 response regulator [Flagellimonas sp. 389]
MANVKIDLSKLTILLILFLSTFSIDAQIDFKSLEFDSVKENIFQRPITAMTMDQYGFIWIGTDGAGLYKFNGFSYDYYGYDLVDSNSVNSNSINSLFLDNSGQLWIGTDAGLCTYNEEQNSFDRFENKQNGKIINNYSNVLCFAQYEDRFLIGTYDGIKELNVANSSMKNYGPTGIAILDLQFSTKGNLYIATNKGLKQEKYHQKGQIEDMALIKDGSSLHVTKLHLDERENLWAGTLKSGVFKGDLKKARTSFHKLNVVERTIMAVASGMDHVFMAVENEGLVILDMNGNVVKHYRYNAQDGESIRSDSVWSILLDNENRLWLGYYENGIGFFDKHYNKFKSIKKEDVGNSIQTNDIKAFAKTEDGKIWIAQINGLDILDTTTGHITNVHGQLESEYKGLKKGIYIEDVFVDSNGNVWIATWGEGIFLLKKGTKTFLNLTAENTSGVLRTNKVRCFTEDDIGRVWIGSFLEGVYYYDSKNELVKTPNGDSYTNSEVVQKDVKVLFHDSYGYIWIGTSSGLYHIEKQDKNDYVAVAHSTAISSKFGGHPSSNRILDIFETQDGTVWFGTNGGGLFSYDRGARDFERLELEGRDLTYVNAIFEPFKNELWLSSKQGVLKVNRETNDVIRFTTYDGLLENFLIDRAIIMDDNNQLYLGTKKGINSIDPENIVYNPYLVKPYLKDVKLFNKMIDPRDKNSPLTISGDTNAISLKHNQTVLTIDYGTISYTRPEKNEYAYFLEGFDETWNYVGAKTSATYTNLEPGTYTFKLKASNNDSIWNDASVILKIDVLPPWWKTIWAYLLYLLFLALLVFSIMYLYRKRVNERNTFRLERERRKQKVELQQQKLQFFTNISHEFRTPLTLIINPIQELIQLNEADFSKSVRQKHNIIHKNAERLSRLINELMDFRKLQSNKLQLKVSHFNLIKQTKNILSFFNEESKRRAMRLDLKYENINLEVWADSGMLDKILFNLLSNAFKVTPNEGRIQVNITAGKKKELPLVGEAPIPVVEISIKDNGPGIDQKDYKKIFKRFYQISELNKSYYGSTGVGLEMVKSFVELHKGVVEVNSELGKGSVFRVFLPFGKEFFSSDSYASIKEDKQVALTDLQLKSKPETYKIEDILSKKELKKKLLIVEDNVDLQDYLISIMEQDYELILASDGQEGWLKTMEHRPDIIITDVIMPLMDGIEFSRKVKNDPGLNQIPIVMLTAKELTKDRIKGMEAGAEAYLVKPFDTKELKVVMEQLLLKKERLLEQYANVPLANIERKEADLDNDFIQRVVGFVQENIENPSLNVEKLSSHLCLSRSQVYRKIKALTGLSPIEFIRRVRLERSRTLFQNDKNLNVSEVAHKVGFLSASYFTVCYKKQYGKLPKSGK